MRSTLSWVSVRNRSCRVSLQHVRRAARARRNTSTTIEGSSVTGWLQARGLILPIPETACLSTWSAREARGVVRHGPEPSNAAIWPEVFQDDQKFSGIEPQRFGERARSPGSPAPQACRQRPPQVCATRIITLLAIGGLGDLGPDGRGGPLPKLCASCTSFDATASRHRLICRCDLKRVSAGSLRGDRGKSARASSRRSSCPSANDTMAKARAALRRRACSWLLSCPVSSRAERLREIKASSRILPATRGGCNLPAELCRLAAPVGHHVRLRPGSPGSAPRHRALSALLSITMSIVPAASRA